MLQINQNGNALNQLSHKSIEYSSAASSAFEALLALLLGCLSLRGRLFGVILSVLRNNQAAFTAFLEAEVFVFDVHVRQFEPPDIVDIVIDFAVTLDLCVTLGLGHFGKAL